MKTSLIIAAIVGTLALSLIVSCTRAATDGELPDDAAIKQILNERVDPDKQDWGIVIGVIDEKGTRVLSRGKMSKGGADLDGASIFEIGSITKTFTGTILGDMVSHGEVKLDDPISKYLPESVKVPARGGKEITLVDLATQSSGLPRLPDNLSPSDSANPYADYTEKDLYAFLSSYELKRAIGAKYEYSNLGMGLLGHALSLKSGTNYEGLVLQRVCGPLGMKETRITLTQDMKARLAVGHDDGGHPVKNWDIPTLAGAGALRSSANDMLKYVAANMNPANKSLAAAMSLAQQQMRPAGPGMTIGLAWHIAAQNGKEIVWHNGGTGGYRSFIGFNAKAKRGVVVLSNSANSMDDIGFHLLNPAFPLARTAVAAGKRKAIEVDAKVLEACVGRYQLAPKIFFDVREEEKRLQVRLTGQSFIDFYPETEEDFFCEVVDAQITFQKDSAGKITALVLHQGGVDQRAPKISDQTAKEPASTKVDPKVYDALAGSYQLAPGAMFTIKKSGDRLMAQLTGQPFFEIFPKSETEYFYKVVDAQLTFEKNSKGEVTGLILHQGGVDQKARRMK